MVESLIMPVGIELLGLYGQELALTFSSAYPNQQVGAPARLLEPRRMDDLEGVGFLIVQHFEDKKIRQCLLT